MPQIACSISDSLQRRLTAAREAGHPINVSGILQKGLEAALAEIYRATTPSNIAAIVARVRHTIPEPDEVHKADESVVKRAKELGAKWAAEEATYENLLNLKSEYANHDDATIRRFLAAKVTHEGGEKREWIGPYMLYSSLYEEDNIFDRPMKSKAFWDNQLGDAINLMDLNFLCEWIKGALEVWRQVAPHIGIPEGG